MISAIKEVKHSEVLESGCWGFHRRVPLAKVVRKDLTELLGGTDCTCHPGLCGGLNVTRPIPSEDTAWSEPNPTLSPVRRLKEGD